MKMLKLLALDRFTILLVAMVLLASFLPISGQAAAIFGKVTTIAIAVLFFYMGQSYLVKLWLKVFCTGNYMLWSLRSHLLYFLYWD